MSPLPAQFTDRWGGSREGLSYEDSVCWHLLLGFDANARAAVTEAQQRIARFGGMHMTPVRWLHVIVLLVGPAAALTREDIGDMLARARAHLARTPPVTVTLGASSTARKASRSPYRLRGHARSAELGRPERTGAALGWGVAGTAPLGGHGSP